MKRILLFAFLVLAFAEASLAARPTFAAVLLACAGESPNWTATTWADVQECHNKAEFQPGDTIALQNSVTASSGLSTTKAFTLKGASNCTLGTVNGIESVPTSCPIVVTTAYNGMLINAVLPAWSDPDTPTVVIHDLGFAGTPSWYQAMIRFEGCGDFDDRSVNLYNLYFDNITQQIFNNESAIGLIHHINLQAPASGQPAFIAYNFGHTWGECTVNTRGDHSWGDPDNLGTNKFLFFEDSVFKNNYASLLTGLDGDNGGRYVLRNSYLYRTRPEGHGRESNNSRSIRAVESYDNVFEDVPSIGYFRGGTGIVADNALVSGSAVINLLNHPGTGAINAPFGGDDGTSPWADNGGSNPLDTLTRTSSTQYTVTDNTKAWTPHAYFGKVIRKTSGIAVTSMSQAFPYTVTVNTATPHGLSTLDYAACWGATGATGYAYNNSYSVTVVDSDTFTYDATGARTDTASGTIKCVKGGAFAYIADNTATQITFLGALHAAQDMIVNVGDTFEINEVTQSMDQPGMGQGTDLGGADYPTATELAGEALSPWYEWDNTNVTGFENHFAGTCYMTCVYSQIVEDTHFYNDTPKPGYSKYTYPHPFQGIEEAVTLDSVTPDEGNQDTTVDDIELVGEGFEGTDMGASTEVNVSGTGVTPTCMVNSDISITCSFAIDDDATPGARSVTVTTDEDTSNAQTFTVVAAGAPTLSSLTPNQCYRGTVCPVTLIGTLFDAGGGTITESCTGIAFSSIVIVGPTTMTANATVDSDAPLVSCSVAVTTSNGTSGTEAFTPASVGLGPRGRLLF